MDLTPTEVDGAPPGGAPSAATVVTAGPWRAAVWADTSARAPYPSRAVAEGPAGTGEAWIKLEPSALALQVTDLPARRGSRELTLRRNGPRLRRRHRVVTLRGEGLHWELRPADERTAVMVDVPRDREVWRMHPDGRRTVADGLDADTVALLLLLDWVQLPSTLGANPLRFV